MERQNRNASGKSHAVFGTEGRGRGVCTLHIYIYIYHAASNRSHDEPLV